MSETSSVTILFLVFWFAILIQLTALPSFQSTRLAKQLDIINPFYPFLITMVSVALILLMRLMHFGWYGFFFVPVTIIYGTIYAVTTVSSRKLICTKSLINQLILTNIILIVAISLQFDADDAYGWLVCGVNIRDDSLYNWRNRSFLWDTATLLVHSGFWIHLRKEMRTLP